ncbi:LuxR C-terminal-related transcriptional regulator [Actinoplanes sp. NPDC024001]|uniref:helix-turn-helix transcriptional regulator n=1 Tax=Actinoplanes sp. NPDC024001 TaxID=3154598 RepID=UPI0033F254DC
MTITGVGGVGKTRTALRLAAELQRAFEDGVWFVDLSALADADLVAEAVAQALGVPEQTLRPQAEVLADHLATRRLLLILDTCEHLTESCAALAARLLRAAPELQVLATSRQPLSVEGEHVFPLLPLPVADPDRQGNGGPENRERDAAVLLFVERASAAAPGFTLTRDNHGAVAELCRRLDGIPLAIELAAVQTRALPVQQIADVIGERSAGRFRLLSRGGVGVPGRQESLRTAIAWSHDLCTPDERLLWRRMSVFAGDFDLAAAQEVCAGDELAAEEMVALVTGLVEKSILLYDRSPFEARYRLLDTIREYGLDLLREAGEQQTVQRRHLDYYLRLARRFDAEWCGPDQLAWHRRMSGELPNLRAALDFSLSGPAEHGAGLELAAALRYLWLACGNMREGRYHLDRVLERDLAAGPALTTATWVCSWLAIAQGDLDAGETRLAQCRRHAEAQGDVAALGWAAYVASVAASFQGDQERALAMGRKAAQLHRHGGDPGTGLQLALAAQSLALTLTGQCDRAAAVAEECRTLCDGRGDGWMRSYADWLRATAELGRDQPSEAITYGREALRFKRQLGDSMGCHLVLNLLAMATVADGDMETAARLLGVVDQSWHAMGMDKMGAPDLMAARAHAQRQVREKLGDRRFAVAFAEGQKLDPDAGMAYAAGDPLASVPADPPPQQTTWAPLTRREREVAELVAAGMTNQQIADRLMIGRSTANTHVEHILTKLDFTSRAQIAAWVAQRDYPRSPGR